MTGGLPRDGVTRPLEVRPSRIHGLGAFARHPIAESVRIIEYTGELILEEEANRRHETFLFSLSDGRSIDGAIGGNESRFINHSCDPNCEAVEVGGHIWIEAIRPIAAGEELTYDYAYEWVEGDEMLASLYSCLCGISGCRGTILARQMAWPEPPINT
jgi:SET domain-containing protein